MSELRYMISDASKKLDVEPHVLRYWEEELEIKIPRNEMGHRYYREQDLRVLRHIKELKEKGFGLRAIKMLLPDIDNIEQVDVNQLLCMQNTLTEQAGRLGQEAPSEDRQEEQAEREVREKETRVFSRAQRKHSGIVLFPGSKDSEVAEDAVGRIEDNGSPDSQSAVDVEGQNDTMEDKPFDSQADQNESAVSMGTSAVSTETGIEVSQMGIDIADPANSKIKQFQTLLSEVMLETLKENNSELSDIITEQVSERMGAEMDTLLKMKESREEERFKRFDMNLRELQKTRMELAATAKLLPKKKKRFGLF